jgi:hypothetical protein
MGFFSPTPTPDPGCDRRWRGRLGLTASAGRRIITVQATRICRVGRGFGQWACRGIVVSWDCAHKEVLHYWDAATIEIAMTPFLQRQTASALGCSRVLPRSGRPCTVCALPCSRCYDLPDGGLRRGRVRGCWVGDIGEARLL